MQQDRAYAIRTATRRDLPAIGAIYNNHYVQASTCTEHPGSVQLQEKLGCVEVGCLRQVGYKFGRWLDVMHTQLML